MTECIVKYVLEIFAISCIQRRSELNNQICARTSLMVYD